MTESGLHGTPPQEGEPEISWRVPVAAAIVGALLVSVLIVYAIVAGPDAQPANDAIQSTDLPPGFTALPGGTGIKVEFITETAGEVLGGVSSAVPGSTDPAQRSPEEIAYWGLETDAGIVVMERQLSTDIATGNTTVAFPHVPLTTDGRLLAYPVTERSVQATTLESDVGEPVRTVEFAIDVSEGARVTGEITIGSMWGHVDWQMEGDTTAKVDVVVTSVGSPEATDLVRLIPGHFPGSRGPGPAEAAPLFGFQGRYRLHLSAESVEASLSHTPIVIEITSTVANTAGKPVPVDVPDDR